MSKNKKRLSVADMIQCPYCHAYSYPKILSDPKNEEEEKAIFCGSCHRNVRPYVEAMDRFTKKMQTKWDTEPKNGIEVETDEGKKEKYLDAVEVMNEVLTEISNEANMKVGPVEGTKIL